MKKIISLLIAAGLCLSFVACSDGNKTEDTTAASVEATTQNAEITAPKITLTTESAEVEAGEQIAVVVHVADAPKTACFDIYVHADGNVQYKSASSKSIENFHLEANRITDDKDEQYVVIRGMVATCADLLDNDIYTIRYTVSEDAVVGDEISFSVSCPIYQVSFDDNGDQVTNCTKNVEFGTLSLVVK